MHPGFFRQFHEMSGFFGSDVSCRKFVAFLPGECQVLAQGGQFKNLFVEKRNNDGSDAGNEYHNQDFYNP